VSPLGSEKVFGLDYSGDARQRGTWGLTSRERSGIVRAYEGAVRPGGP